PGMGRRLRCIPPAAWRLLGIVVGIEVGLIEVRLGAALPQRPAEGSLRQLVRHGARILVVGRERGGAGDPALAAESSALVVAPAQRATPRRGEREHDAEAAARSLLARVTMSLLRTGSGLPEGPRPSIMRVASGLPRRGTWRGGRRARRRCP